MRIQIELTGVSPLLMHNIHLADPDNEFVKQIAEITAKRKKTEDDRRAIERLEWFGGLYTQDGVGVVMPTRSIRKCLIEAAKISKQGKQLGRAVAFTDLNVPLTYDGPDDLEKLFAADGSQNRAMVGIAQRRIVRVRPQFTTWAIVAEAHLLTEVMDADDLFRIVQLAGVTEGLGDNRVNGYGRFTGEVKS